MLWIRCVDAPDCANIPLLSPAWPCSTGAWSGWQHLRGHSALPGEGGQEGPWGCHQGCVQELAPQLWLGSVSESGPDGEQGMGGFWPHTLCTTSASQDGDGGDDKTSKMWLFREVACCSG